MQKMNPGVFPALWLWLWLFLVSPCQAEKPEVLPVPPNVVPEIIASDMRFNGAPMQIVQFTTLDAEEALKFYREYFVEHAKEGKYTEKGAARRAMIGAMMPDKRLVNVEMKPKGKAAVDVLVSSLDIFQMEIPEKLAKDIPRMPGTTVIQHQDSRDGVKSNRFIIMENRQSVEGNAMYLREHFIGMGWQRDRDQTIKPGTHRLLAFSKENRHTMVDIQKRPDQMTVVLYNEMSEK
ncbi:MAG: hypothetical protein LBB76_09190 [Azoarcus sp.]|jgi:hypothetical protein|nr:hypothetical protein [Azoarcus sp.]